MENTIGQLIRDKRINLGLSQKRLGVLSSLSDSEIMKIETGERKKPNLDNLCRIAQALNIHPLEMMVCAGYINQKDCHPLTKLKGIEKLNDNEIAYVQLMIDFIISRKNATCGENK